jgi:type I restriction enzyme S subunit
MAHGFKSSFVHVKKGDLSSTLLPIPSVIEQTAITNALSDVDTLITSIEKLIAKKQAIKIATMQQLLTGRKRLPPFDAYQEGAFKGQSKSTQQTELGEIPEGWVVKNIGDMFTVTAGGDLNKGKFSKVLDQNYPYPIFSNAITDSGLYGYSSVYDYDGEFLTITARGGIGHTERRNSKFCAIGRLLVLEAKTPLNYVFIKESINEYISFASESSGVPQLTAPQVSSYQLLFPPVDEQEKIAEMLSHMNSEVMGLKKRLAKTQQIKQGMMQELLTGKTRLI